MSRPVDVDVAEIERLYFVEGLNAAQVGLKVGCSPNTVRRRIEELDRTPRAPGKPVKYPPVELGVCGTPGCTDLACSILPGECHCGCGARTPIAGRHDRRHRRVKGEPCRFIVGHDVLSDEGRRTQSANMAAKRNDGTISTARVALARHGSTRVFGREAAERAAAKGKKAGAPSDVLDDRVVVERIDELDQKRYSQQSIARIVSSEFGIDVSRDQVYRALRKLRGTPLH
jgi:transposase